jgi:sigma-70-like protein
MAQREINEILQRAIDDLPNAFRLVLVARAVEGMSIEDTAELLGILPETVKTRLHRARALLRAKLERDLGPSLPETFPFEGDRCDRVGNEKAPSALGPWSRRNGSCPQSSCCLPPAAPRASAALHRRGHLCSLAGQVCPLLEPADIFVV